MIDWQTIQDTLREWMARASGLRTFWRGEAVPIEDRPYAELAIGSSQGLGVDETRIEYDDTRSLGKELIRTQCGNRLFTLSCRVRTRDQSPTGAARFYLEKVRTALKKASSLEMFRTAQLAVVAAEPLINLDVIFDDREESQAVMDVRFATVANETDAHDQGGYITTVELRSNKLKDQSGTDLPDKLQIDDIIP